MFSPQFDSQRQLMIPRRETNVKGSKKKKKKKEYKEFRAVHSSHRSW